LVDQVRIFDLCQPAVVPITKDAAKFSSRGGDATRNNQRRAAQVDESDLSTLVDPPPSPQLGRHIRLASMRYPGVARSRHVCIVAN
jgi:hypothetical protein